MPAPSLYYSMSDSVFDKAKNDLLIDEKWDPNILILRIKVPLHKPYLGKSIKFGKPKRLIVPILYRECSTNDYIDDDMTACVDIIII